MGAATAYVFPRVSVTPVTACVLSPQPMITTLRSPAVCAASNVALVAPLPPLLVCTQRIDPDGALYVKAPVSVAVWPSGFFICTLHAPAACAAVVALSCVDETNVTAVAATPQKLTVAP